MPGFITHHLFGIKILSNLPDNYLKDTIQKNLSSFKLGLQGPDIFFYYIPSLLKQGKNNIGSYMHSNKSNYFFKNSITMIDSLNNTQKEIVVSYLSGFLCHYFLDATCHPYIYYKSGYLTKYLEASNEYYASHRTLENNIDTLLLQKYKLKKNVEFKKESITNLSKKESDLICYLLSTVIKRTYKYNAVSPQLIKLVLRCMKYECIFLSDKKGSKKRMLIYLENKISNYNLLSSLIPSDSYTDHDDILNISHCIWNSPWNKAKYNSSFIDLFMLSLTCCSDALLLLNQYLLSITSSMINSNLLRREFLQFIGNNSYHTGLDCNIHSII